MSVCTEDHIHPLPRDSPGTLWRALHNTQIRHLPLVVVYQQRSRDFAGAGRRKKTHPAAEMRRILLANLATKTRLGYVSKSKRPARGTNSVGFDGASLLSCLLADLSSSSRNQNTKTVRTDHGAGATYGPDRCARIYKGPIRRGRRDFPVFVVSYACLSYSRASVASPILKYSPPHIGLRFAWT